MKCEYCGNEINNVIVVESATLYTCDCGSELSVIRVGLRLDTHFLSIKDIEKIEENERIMKCLYDRGLVV